MTLRGLAAAILLPGALLLSGCEATPDASFDAEALPEDPCLLWQIAFEAIPDRCGEAVTVAETRLGWLHWPVASRVLRLSLCPPNARCRAPGPGEFHAWVIYEFITGDPVMIHVHLAAEDEAGPLVADEPEPLPDWLIEELATTGAS
jgi:hypothetical protein